MSALLEVRGLGVSYGDTPVLRDVALDLARQGTLGIVGESGSGKSTTLLAIAGLLAPAATVAGSSSVKLDGRELIGLGEREWRSVHGGAISCVFQNARGALHPMMTVGAQVARAFRLHHDVDKAQARAETIAMFTEVGLENPERLVRRFPSQLSGGQCQRVMIAMALITRPQLILADEPTSGLDVTVQRQVLATLADRAREHSTAMLIISHDIGVIRRTCERVAVMYNGEIVEQGAREDVLERPQHAYTQALLAASEMGVRDDTLLSTALDAEGR